MKPPAFLAACAAAVVLIAAAYANSFHNSFHFDDAHVIESNVYIRSLHNVPRFFTDAHTFSSLPQNATYRPLVTLSLALDYARGGLDPFPYHVTQFALLLATWALLIALFAPLIGAEAALFAATLFSVHTANTETMNLISARSELLSTVGLLGSFVLYQRSSLARRTLLYLLPLAVGALAKAPLVVFAPLLFVYVRLFERERRAWREAIPPLILGVGLLVFLNAMNAPEWQSGRGSAWAYLITQPFVWMHDVRLFLLPLGLTADTDMGTFAHAYDTSALAGDAFVALLIVAILRTARCERTRPVAFGLAWFAIALIPTSIFPLAEVTNEHRLFFAFIGLVLAASAAAREVVRSGRFAIKPESVAIKPESVAIKPESVAIAAACILVLHAVGTHARNEVWRSEESLWSDVVVTSPRNGRAWMNHGLTEMAHGRYAAAKASFERAAGLTPNYSILEINRGIVEGELGDEILAELHFHRALALRADHNAHFFYARWLVRQGRSPEALPHLREALRLSPGYVDARGLLLRLDAAIAAPETAALIDQTRRIDPDDRAVAEVERAWPDFDAAFRNSLAATGRRDWLAAAHACRDALRHDPRSADAWNNLGWALQQLGFRTEAADAYRRALVLRPDHERARNNLAALG